jgi:phosphate transport system substrate-binding protein
MRLRKIALFLAVATAVSTVVGCQPSGNIVNIQGAGATFPAPLYERWFLEFYLSHRNVRTNYLAIGSGAGVSQFEQGLTSFGASDESLDKKKLAAVAKKLSINLTGTEHGLLQIPMTAGSIALSYNLPGNPEIKLTRHAYVSIILGEITSWDDAEIRKSNPDVDLPSLPITFIRRADSSGTTFNFTNHLSAVDKRWAKPAGPGPGKTVDWPVGIGGKGNAGVAALISQTPGALGYIETGFAELSHLPMASLQNKAGKFVEPTFTASQAALSEAQFNDIFQATVTDPKGQDAYPIVTFTWIICRQHYADARIGNALRELFQYCLTDGQELSQSLGYVPLPREFLKKILKVVDRIQAVEKKRAAG